MFREIFASEYNEGIEITFDVTPESIWKSQVIIVSLFRGEEFICKNEYKYRNKGVIIGLTDSVPVSSQKIPLCYRDILLIQRRTSFEMIYSQFVQAWNKRHSASHYPHQFSCRNCCHKNLSSWESNIAKEMLAGRSPKDIAKKYDIPQQKINSCTYSLKKKFNVESNKEMLSLMKYFSAKK